VARRARRKLVIVPYRTYGTPRLLTVCGRVLRDRRLPASGPSSRRWRNLLAFYRHLESDEVAGVRVRARLGGHEVEGTADREGYFNLALKPPGKTSTSNPVDVALADEPAVRATADVMVPSPRANFGVISDIDDTVVQTNVISKARMLLTVAFSNAHTRKPFKGVGAFYRALHAGVNPFFYVSKSPWNLYPILCEFFDLQKLPHGPLLLRDYGLHLLRRSRDHKKNTIEDILATYPRLPFVLIGDSGEEDPELYAGVLRRHPGRIRAIYIRSVDPAPGRIRAIERLAAEVAKTGCQLVLAADSELAAAHAAAEGLIQPSELRRVREDRRSDESIASKAAASTGVLK
jgi:phosphatidate phosphatase APP1